jgi:hypothetical protein
MAAAAWELALFKNPSTATLRELTASVRLDAPCS